MSRIGQKIIKRLEQFTRDLEQEGVFRQKAVIFRSTCAGRSSIMGYAIRYVSTEPVTAEQRREIGECVSQLVRGHTWLSCEPIHFRRDNGDGFLSGSSKPNFDPHPDDHASAETEGLPDGTVREVLDGLCLISRRFGVDWEIGDDYIEVIGYIRNGDLDDDVWTAFETISTTAQWMQPMSGGEHFEDSDGKEEIDPDGDDFDDDGPRIIRFPGV